MARVTVEDCVEIITNRFDLILFAGQRVREIDMGASLTVERNKDKNTVVALREIAEGTLNLDVLKDNLVKRFQRVNVQEEQKDSDENDDIHDISFDQMSEEDLLSQLKNDMNSDIFEENGSVDISHDTDEDIDEDEDDE